MINELMVDIETSGDKPGCKVLSLSAFGFDKNGNQVEFYRRFDAKSQSAQGLFDTDSTMTWWQSQGKEAFEEAFGGDTDPIKGIAEFKQWVMQNFNTGKYDKFKAWSRGIDFDFPIMNRFFAAFGFNGCPWQFWQQYDYRTVANLFPVIKSAEGNELKHSALEDAKAQMRGLRAFYSLTKD
jgi:hypothetical protein